MDKQEEIEAYEALRKAPNIQKGSNVKYRELERKVVKILKKSNAAELSKYDIYEINGEWRRIGINSNGGVYFEEMSFLNSDC